MIDFCPQLRPHHEFVRDPADAGHRYVVDLLRQAAPLRLSLQEFEWLLWFDGKRSLRDIHQLAMRQASAMAV